MEAIVYSYLTKINSGKKVDDFICNDEDQATEILNMIAELSEDGFRKYEIKNGFEILINYESLDHISYSIINTLNGWLVQHSYIIEDVKNVDEGIKITSFNELYQIVSAIENGSKKYKK
jgi:hypothetical protein